MIGLLAVGVASGLIVWAITRSGGLAALGIGTGGTPDNQLSGKITVGGGGAIGSSPFQNGSKVSMGLQSAALGTGAASAGLFGTTVAASQAVPIIGAAIAGAAAIWGIIQAHHTRAVAAEASVLNQAVPHFRQTLVQVCAAVLGGQITDQAQFNSVLDGLVSDYYTEVSKIIKGRWPYTGPGGNPPSTCNGPCVVGHWWIESDAQTLKTFDGGFVNAVKAGRHSHIDLSAVPAHAGFQGSPSITIQY